MRIQNLRDEEKLAWGGRCKGRTFREEGVSWAVPEALRSLALLRTWERASAAEGREPRRDGCCGGWSHLLLRCQVPLGRNGVGEEACEQGECLSVPHGLQLLALTPSLLLTELLAAKKTHTCE